MESQTNSTFITFSENLKLNSDKSKDANCANSAKGWSLTKVDALNFNKDYFMKRGLYFACLNDYGQDGNNGHKTKENTDFSTISAIVLDYDGKDGKEVTQLRSADAIKLISSLEFKVYIVSGASYEESVRDSYRIIFPLNEHIDKATFREWMDYFISDERFGCGLDKSCKDFRFWNPSNGKLFNTNEASRLATMEDLISLIDFNKIKSFKVELGSTVIEQIQSNKEKSLSNKRLEGIDNLTKKDIVWESYKDTQIGKKVTLCCPFCDPKARKDPSRKNSFVSRGSSGRLFLYCSSEAKTYWEEIDYEVRFKPFFSFSDDVFEISPLTETCKIEYNKTGARNFHILTNTDYGELKAEAYTYLVKKRRFGLMPRIKYECTVDVEKFKINLEIPKNKVHVLVPAIQVVEKENHVIEDYLDQTFRKHSDFIKDWIALYSYTNWKPMATLILTGGRGTGKTTFTNMLSAIFKGHSQTPRSADDRFNSFLEEKLLVIDEAFAKGKDQYIRLKQISGGEYLTVEKKYKEAYKVENNIHVIMTSNDNFPLFVESEELIEDVNNNQWFMYKFPEIGQRDALYLSKLVDRIGHWLRTEGKSRYEKLKGNTHSRYGQEVPITDELRDLFSFSTSPRENKAKTFIEYYLASPFDENRSVLNFRHLEDWCKENKYEPTFVLKDLKNLGYIESGRTGQVSFQGRRFAKYPLTQKALDLVK